MIPKVAFFSKLGLFIINNLENIEKYKRKNKNLSKRDHPEIATNYFLFCHLSVFCPMHVHNSQKLLIIIIFKYSILFSYFT